MSTKGVLWILSYAIFPRSWQEQVRFLSFCSVPIIFLISLCSFLASSLAPSLFDPSLLPFLLPSIRITFFLFFLFSFYTFFRAFFPLRFLPSVFFSFIPSLLPMFLPFFPSFLVRSIDLLFHSKGSGEFCPEWCPERSLVEYGVRMPEKRPNRPFSDDLGNLRSVYIFHS